MSHFVPERTSLVGRAEELAALERRLQEGARLLTIVAPGGLGKTRLAIRLCTTRRQARVEAVAFVDLSSAATAGDVAGLVGDALGITLRAGASLRELVGQVGGAMRAVGPLLLALDNFEHVVHAAAATVGAWLDLAPEARMLVTSREKLRLDGESCLELAPLAAGDGAQLFVERARTLGAEDQPIDPEILDRIVARLDGVPLALELAASQLAMLPPRALLDRLESRAALDMLRSPRRDVAAKHATIRAAIDGSWDLLTGRERTALCGAALFARGFDLRAAAAIAAEPMPEHELLATLRALRDKAMLRRTDAPGASEPRFELYELVRSYALEQVESSIEAATLIGRHRDHVLGLAEALPDGAALRELAADLRLVFERFEQREPLIAARAALQFDRVPLPHRGSEEHLALLSRAARALVGSQDEALLHLERAIGDAERTRGDFAGARARLASALARATDPVLQATLCLSLAELELDAGRPAQAMDHAERAQELAPSEGTVAVTAELFAAWSCFDRGDLSATEERCRRALASGPGRDVPRLMAQFHLFLALALMRRGARALAQPEFVQARKLAQQADEPFLESFVIQGAEDLALFEGDFARAERELQEGLELARRMGYGLAEAASWTKLGLVALDQGQLQKARASYERALDFHSSNQDSVKVAIVTHFLALIDADEGKLGAAEQTLLTVIETAHKHGHRLAEGLSRAHLAIVLTRGGRRDEAEAAIAAPHVAGLEDDSSFQQVARIARALLAWPAEDARASLFPDAPQSVGSTVRITRRIATRGLEHGASPPAKRTRLTLGSEARWFRVDPGTVVDLKRRGGVRRILLALAEGALRSPGSALAVTALVTAGWPGERIQHESGRIRRVYTSIGLLRDLGLRGVIESRDDGYLIGPDVAVEIVDGEPP